MPVFFSFEGTEEIKVLNVNIILNFVMAVFNGKLKGFNKTKDNYSLELDNNDSNNPMYSSIMYLSDEQEVNKQNNDEWAKLMTELCLAKKASDYLREEYERKQE